KACQRNSFWNSRKPAACLRSSPELRGYRKCGFRDEDGGAAKERKEKTKTHAKTQRRKGKSKYGKGTKREGRTAMILGCRILSNATPFLKRSCFPSISLCAFASLREFFSVFACFVPFFGYS